MKRANGAGSVVKLSGNRRRPWAVKVAGWNKRVSRLASRKMRDLTLDELQALLADDEDSGLSQSSINNDAFLIADRRARSHAPLVPPHLCHPAPQRKSRPAYRQMAHGALHQIGHHSTLHP